MKILQGTANIAGGPNLIAREMRKLGHDAKSYSLTPPTFSKLQTDLYLKKDHSKVEMVKNFVKYAKNYDVFQFWFGKSLLGYSLKDISILKKMNKKVFFYFCGCDIRDEKVIIYNHEFSACHACVPKSCNINREKAKRVAETYGDKIFVSTPDLLEFVEDSILLPQPIDFQKIDIIKNLSRKKNKVFTVAHAPTNRLMKGTKYIVEAIENLKLKGYSIELKLIEGLTHEQALNEYFSADLAIDQILAGSYGATTVEMMALGVPTIVYIREDLIKHYPEPPPVISANPKDIEAKLKDIITNKIDLLEISKKGKIYANNYHSPHKIAQKLISYYQL